MDIIDVNSLFPSIERVGILGYWIVLLISLLESLVFVGLAIPGTIFTILIGFSSAQGYFDLDIGDLIWFAAIGAVLGDGISYFLGTKGTHLFRHENKILKLSHLDRGKQFFAKHGRKSVFFGRFIGPLRPIIPFVAGLSKMKKSIFFFWNITSAFLWASFYLFLGYFFGNSLRTIQAWSAKLGIILLALVFLIIVGIFVRKKVLSNSSGRGTRT